MREHAARLIPHLNGNQLKLLGILSMTIDHAGLLLFPELRLLRILGRLAFPIFAYMIAEGWHYTHNRRRYFLTLFLLGVGFQPVYWIESHSLFLNIFLVYSLSLALIALIEWAQQRARPWGWLCVGGALLGMLLLCELPERLWPELGLTLDYGFFGVLLPVLVYFPKTKRGKLALMAAGLALLGLRLGGVQPAGLLTVPVLACYNGLRGKLRMKYLFYIYYPAHLLVLWLIQMLR